MFSTGLGTASRCPQSISALSPASCQVVKGSEVDHTQWEDDVASNGSDREVIIPKSWKHHQTLMIKYYIKHHLMETMIGCVLLINMGLAVWETDALAAKRAVPSWVRPVLRSFLALYIIEIGLNVYWERMAYFSKASHVLECVIVGADLLGEILGHVLLPNGQLPSASWLRVFRLLRLLRLVRAVRSLRELSFILRSLSGVLRAIVWAAGVLLFVLTFWSIIAVEIIHPLNETVSSTGIYAGCERCPRAFSTVMDANLTFCQYIIAGDSWGLTTIPIIEHYPWTAVFFLAVILSINMGVMNLILSVIVDKAVQMHEEDIKLQVKEKKLRFRRATVELKHLCQEMDSDKDGVLSYEEVLDGYDNNEDFALLMQMLDVRREDLPYVFSVLKQDEAEAVGYDEFVTEIHKMKTQDSRTLLLFIRYYLRDVMKTTKEELDILRNFVVTKLQTQEVMMSELISLVRANQNLLLNHGFQPQYTAEGLETQNGLPARVVPSPPSNNKLPEIEHFAELSFPNTSSMGSDGLGLCMLDHIKNNANTKRIQQSDSLSVSLELMRARIESDFSKILVQLAQDQHPPGSLTCHGRVSVPPLLKRAHSSAVETTDKSPNEVHTHGVKETRKAEPQALSLSTASQTSDTSQIVCSDMMKL